MTHLLLGDRAQRIGAAGAPKWIALAVVHVSVLTAIVDPPSAEAFVFFDESFDTDTADTTSTLSHYSQFTKIGTSLTRVVGGELLLQPSGAAVDHEFLINGFAGDLRVTLDVGKNPGGPDFNVGLRIGDNRLVFHPGFFGDGGAPPGSFRVEGPGGFGNRHIGFVPAGGVAHRLRVDLHAETGEFDIQLFDTHNPANKFTASFTNAGYAPGDHIGPTVEGFLKNPAWVGLFDNFQVTALPEPTSAALLLAAAALLGRRRGERLDHRRHPGVYKKSPSTFSSKGSIR